MFLAGFTSCITLEFENLPIARRLEVSHVTTLALEARSSNLISASSAYAVVSMSDQCIVSANTRNFVVINIYVIYMGYYYIMSVVLRSK